MPKAVKKWVEVEKEKEKETTKTGKPVAKQLESDLYAVQAMPPVKFLTGPVFQDQEGRKYYNPVNGFAIGTERSLKSGQEFFIVRAKTSKRGEQRVGGRWPQVGARVSENKRVVVEVGQDFTHSVTSRKSNWVITQRISQDPLPSPLPRPHSPHLATTLSGPSASK